ncbi:PepSY-associated TM helix domain-containing protein [Janibacter melonis]|uniref:PepSY-associated TM helix domain-containing protein n=1 Tax=Janibacter melonis TaxID=262209 RepID=UPI00209442B7|nr:PepSY-associated TM helix domain-containing protein [Janibacter melonis]
MAAPAAAHPAVARDAPAPRGRAGYRRTRDRHAAVGAWVLVGALGLSATGITWSQLAGERVTDLRAQLGWSAPALDTELSGGTAAAGAHHAGHHGGGSGEAPRVAPVSFDAVLGRPGRRASTPARSRSPPRRRRAAHGWSARSGPPTPPRSTPSPSTATPSR